MLQPELPNCGYIKPLKDLNVLLKPLSNAAV